MNCKIVKVDNKALTKKFIDFPHGLYKDDPNYVPQLYIAVKELLSKKKNPFFKHSEAEVFLAMRGNEVVGRIAAIANRNYNNYHDSNIGFFGFFDCIEDYEVAEKLLDTAYEWCKAKGFNQIHGPTNFTTNDTAGLLIDGFDSPPVVEMTYNAPYYEEFVDRYGFTKEMDLFAYWIPTKTASEKYLRISAALQERLEKKGITFRPMNMKNIKAEIQQVKKVYRSAWEKNWGFVPPTDAEFDVLAANFKMILDPRYCYVAELDGKMIGFSVGLPDINEIIINMKRGRLFPFGIFKLLMGKKKTRKVRIVLLGVFEEYRNLGIAAVFFAKLINSAKTYGLEGGEASWVLENNTMMVRGAENLNGKKYKTYRIYSKAIS
ncbi:MAG: GNAT family N-acetyltransferase [Saprospiraceae bacterium]|nr:GNAT family N-acetyltransferase [Saprospiraceae bacterium]